MEYSKGGDVIKQALTGRRKARRWRVTFFENGAYRELYTYVPDTNNTTKEAVVAIDRVVRVAKCQGGTASFAGDVIHANETGGERVNFSESARLLADEAPAREARKT